MSGINFMGSYSGIDRSTIDQLMEAERVPLIGLSNKKSDISEKQNAWKDVNTRLNSLFERLNTLENKDTYTSMNATSTNKDIVTMSATNGAHAGNYTVKVDNLATKTSIIGGQVVGQGESITDALDHSGTLSITNADGQKIDIGINNDDSLKTIVDKINAATTTPEGDNEVGKKIGVMASIIDGRIVITDDKTGDRNITLSGDVLGDLQLSENPTLETMGKNANFTINGVAVERSSNTISDVIEGVTINLHKTHGDGQSDSITVSQNTEKLTKAVGDFVEQYNSTMTFIEDKLKAGDPEMPGSGGSLSGDSTLMRLHSSLRSMVTSSITNKNTDINDISQLGVSTIDRFGKLQFDSSKLLKALEENPDNVMNFFISSNDQGDKIGFTENLKNYVDSFVHSRDGIIRGKTESYDRTLKDLNNQIDRFNDRMIKREEYYVRTFTALDVAMMQAESQMSWLSSQIEGLSAQMGRK